MSVLGELAQRVRIVLVNPQHTCNIGSTARAMKTMGLRRLVLVDPLEFPSREASWRAVHAQDLLTSALVVPTLADAVADCALVIGTSVRERRLALPLLDPREAATLALAQAARDEVAIVFGRETSGLSESELLLCNRQLGIPADPDYPSLNLAMAVQVVAYELRMAAASTVSLRPRVPPATGSRMQVELDSTATAGELNHLLAHAEATFTAVGYHDPARPRLLLPRLRRLFARAGLLASEVRLLRGALSAIDAALASRRTEARPDGLAAGAGARGEAEPQPRPAGAVASGRNSGPN